MAVEYKSPSTVKETPEDDYVPELKLLQSIVVQSSLGQTVLKVADNFLWTVEKCAEWSLPGQEIVGDENGKSSGKSELVRPLPWILFLPSLLMLRTIRLTVNVGAFIAGYPKVTPSKLVKFLQLSRTRLNDIKNCRTKEKRDKDEKLSMNEARRALIKSIRLTLSSLSCLDTSKPIPSPPPTKIHVSSVLDPDAATSTSEEKSGTESTDATEKREKLIDYSDSEEDDNETLQEKIERLALESSDGDEDFPGDSSVSSNENGDKDNEDDDDEDEDDDDDDDDDEEVEVDVPHNEVRELVAETSEFLGKNNFGLPKEIEKFQAAERATSWQVSNQHSDSSTCHTTSKESSDLTFYSPINSDSDTSKPPTAQKCVSGDSLKTNEYANGEMHFSASMISETSKTSGEERTNNGAVVEKRGAKVSKCHKAKRTNHGNRRKK